MSLELSFKDICNTIRKQGKEDPKLIEAVDNLLGLALICSPVVLGPAAVALLPILGTKNELIKIGKSVFEKLTKKKEEDYLLRHETMRTAYGLLVFTSFFDALDASLPKAFRKEIGLLDSEKAFLARNAEIKSISCETDEACNETDNSQVSTYTFAFPHPTETLDDQKQRQLKIWKQMRQGFVDFVQKLAFWENADEKKRETLLSGLAEVEEMAAKRFEAQYFELARKFEDFAVWANLQGHKGTKSLIGELSDYVKHYVKLSAASEKSIDIGFGKLREAVLSIPKSLHTQQAIEIAESLNKHYQARVNDPIIEDKDISDEAGPRLSFPKVCDAFVPQSFRVLRQEGISRRLEDESTWSDLPRRNDLGAFLLSYLSSPYSTEAPLLILGHPGSGKSLLTTILAARLMSTQFTAIRVPLREVNADADIVTQIEEAIRRLTGASFDSWIRLSALFKNFPPLVILDGYDELLQASGQVFASYIKDAQRFQQRETEQGRPLRIIITSRVTLIDKAAVPSGSTIVRLLEFDQDQRECWSGIWNKTNAHYFKDASIEKFVLPRESEKGAEKILNLAEQPLLLLMLALYDSQRNELRNSEGLDRTKLYDSLLRRFVSRERGKEKEFSDARKTEQEKALSLEMQRLGVAALGMYNRRKVHILSHELDDDLAFFKLEREVVSSPGKSLSQADLLLGSFFFVHKSKAQHSSGAEEMHEETAAFEFLHNTLGEFLSADFILRRAVSQVEAVRAAETNEALRSISDKMLGTADGFEREWFASLVYTPLFTRPVIMEMIREWAPHVLGGYGISEKDFVETLEKIILNQIKRLLSKREMPQIMRKETAQEGYRVPFGDHPLVGHIAIYSINLILLRLVAGSASFVFDECEVASHEDGTRPWDRLMYIWRSWFSLGNLNALTAVMLAERTDSKINIAAKSLFQAEESKSRLHEFYNVAVSLGDNVSAGIAGFFLEDPSGGHKSGLRSLLQRLHAEGYELGLHANIQELVFLVEDFPEYERDFWQHAEMTLDKAMRSERRDQIANVCSIITRALDLNAKLPRTHFENKDRFDFLLPPRVVAHISTMDPRSARVFVDLAKELGLFKWINEFLELSLDYMYKVIRKDDLFEILESDTGRLLDWFLLVKEILAEGNSLFPIIQDDLMRDRRNRNFEAIERFFYLPDLQKLMVRNPEGALVCLQILYELQGQHFKTFVERELGPAFFERLLHPRHLGKFMGRNPEGALAWLQILQELGGEQHFKRFVEQEFEPEFFERLLQPRRLSEFIDHNPGGVLALLQILQELGGEQHFKRFVEQEYEAELFKQLLHPRHLGEFMGRNPEGALAWLQILQELGGEQHFKRFVERELGPAFFERLLHSRHLGEFMGRNPEGALAWLQILQELGGEQHFKRLVERELGPAFFERLLHPRHFLTPNKLGIQSIRVGLFLARILRSRAICEALIKGFKKDVKDSLSLKSLLLGLPIESLRDLRWLVDQTDDTWFKALVSDLTP